MTNKIKALLVSLSAVLTGSAAAVVNVAAEQYDAIAAGVIAVCAVIAAFTGKKAVGK